jgi:ribosomal protein S8
MKKVIMSKEMEVPISAMIEVTDLLIENEISHSLVATDEDEDTITIELQYDKDEREIIHEIEDVIEDHMGEDDDSEEEEEEEDDDSK